MTENLARTLYLARLDERLRAAKHGEKGGILAEACKWLNCSSQSVYNELKALGLHKSSRKLRSDKGDSAVTRDEIFAVSSMIASTLRANKKDMMAVGDAIDEAVANGYLKTPISSSRMLRLMRVHGCHPKQLARPDPHVLMQSNHPNHVWQLDASICVLYRLKDGRTSVMDQRKFNARKPRDLAAILNERILRYAVTDHTSGAVFARYYLSAGEDQSTLFEFLMDAFTARADGQMHGVPWLLVWDAGSANQAHAITSMLTGLAIRHWAHRPGNPRAKGQVECVHNVIERKFESRLTFVKTESIEQLNARLDTWLTDFNGNSVHSRHGHTRWGLWQMIRQDQLRLCPPRELCSMLMNSKPVERKVSGNLTFSFTPKGQEHGLFSVEHIPGVRAGEAVSVTINPYRPGSAFVVGVDESGATRYYECERIAVNAFGFAVDSPVFGESYKSMADTDVDRARKEVNELAFGARDTLDAANAKAKGRLAFDGKIDPFKAVAERAAKVPSFIQRRGTALDVPLTAQIELRPLSHVQALMELNARLDRPMLPAEAAFVRSAYPEGVPETELDALQARIETLGQPDPIPAAPLRLVAVK